MTSKGQKFNNYSDKSNIKDIILEEYKLKRNIRELAKRYNIPKGTIKTWKRKFIDHPELYPNTGKGRGRTKEKALTKDDWKQRYEI